MVVKKIQNLKFKMQKWNSKSIRRPHDFVVLIEHFLLPVLTCPACDPRKADDSTRVTRPSNMPRDPSGSACQMVNAWKSKFKMGPRCFRCLGSFAIFEFSILNFQF